MKTGFLVRQPDYATGKLSLPGTLGTLPLAYPIMLDACVKLLFCAYRDVGYQTVLDAIEVPPAAKVHRTHKNYARHILDDKRDPTTCAWWLS